MNQFIFYLLLFLCLNLRRISEKMLASTFSDQTRVTIILKEGLDSALNPNQTIIVKHNLLPNIRGTPKQGGLSETNAQVNSAWNLLIGLLCVFGANLYYIIYKKRNET